MTQLYWITGALALALGAAAVWANIRYHRARRRLTAAERKAMDERERRDNAIL